MKHKWRVYINPFDESGNYTGYQEVTSDVNFSSMGSIDTNLDQTDYDIGIYRNANINLKLNNLEGKYSDVGGLTSIFKFKRSNSLVKITWEMEDEGGAYCGTLISGGSYLSAETTLFTGFLKDDSTTMDLLDQEISFDITGLESILDNTLVPFAAISDHTAISTTLYQMLNVAPITNYLTVSPGNISVGYDVAVDDVTDFNGKTVSEAVDSLLLSSNSVFYIIGTTLYIKPRTPTADIKFSFYGQASLLGVENIQNITNIRSGINRLLNSFVWTVGNTSTVEPPIASPSASVLKYGVLQKDISNNYITDTTAQKNLIDSLLAEFQYPKQEFDLSIEHGYDTIPLNLLDRVQIDYPTVMIPWETNPLPICGVTVCGVGVLPRGLWAFTLDTTKNFKIIGKSIDINTALTSFKMREI